MSVRNDVLDQILNALAELRNSEDFDIRLAVDPIPLRTDHLTISRDETPILMSEDQGNDTKLVQSATETMFSIDVALFYYTRRDTWEQTEDELNSGIAAIQQLINSKPDMGTAILRYDYISGLGHFFEPVQEYGYTTILTRVLYAVTNGVY